MSAEPDAQRSRSIRLIALFKLFKAAVCILVGLGALRLLKPDATTVVRHTVEVLATRADQDLIRRILTILDALSPRRIEIIAAGAFVYACLCMVEGLGLWWEKRWTEYVVVIATLSAVPFELIALIRHSSFTRLTAMLINLAVALYLIHCLKKQAQPPRA